MSDKLCNRLTINHLKATQAAFIDIGLLIAHSTFEEVGKNAPPQ